MARFIKSGRRLKGSDKTYKLSRGIIKRNDISLLILDERWNGLFANREKPEEIVRLEQELTELLKEQARLIARQKECFSEKNNLTQKAIDLTANILENKKRHTKLEIKKCWKKVKQLNKMLESIENSIKELPYRIRRTNFKLLECMINTVYISYRAEQRKREELDALIKQTHEKLKYYIAEREQLQEQEYRTYEYFHNLLGAEELQRLDEQYFAGRHELTE